MLWRAATVVIALVGLYLALWHTGVPLSHFDVFGRPFGSNHTVHAAVGIVLLGVAEWLRLHYWNATSAVRAT